MNGNGGVFVPPPPFTRDDVRRLAAIVNAAREQEFGTEARLLREFYGDLARAERMPRQMLYFHIGLLVASLADACDDPMD